jgi:hypothetical protein
MATEAAVLDLLREVTGPYEARGEASVETTTSGPAGRNLDFQLRPLKTKGCQVSGHLEGGNPTLYLAFADFVTLEVPLEGIESDVSVRDKARRFLLAALLGEIEERRLVVNAQPIFSDLRVGSGKLGHRVRSLNLADWLLTLFHKREWESVRYESYGTASSSERQGVHAAG